MRACKGYPPGIERVHLNGGLLVLVGPPVGTQAAGSEGWAEGCGSGACVTLPAPSSLDAVEGEHSLHVLRQGLGLWPLYFDMEKDRALCQP